MSAYTDMYRTGKKNKHKAKQQTAQGPVQEAQNDFGMNKQNPPQSQR